MKKFIFSLAFMAFGVFAFANAKEKANVSTEITESSTGCHITITEHHSNGTSQHYYFHYPNITSAEDCYAMAQQILAAW